MPDYVRTTGRQAGVRAARSPNLVDAVNVATLGHGAELDHANQLGQRVRRRLRGRGYPVRPDRPEHLGQLRAGQADQHRRDHELGDDHRRVDRRVGRPSRCSSAASWPARLSNSRSVGDGLWHALVTWGVSVTATTVMSTLGVAGLLGFGSEQQRRRQGRRRLGSTAGVGLTRATQRGREVRRLLPAVQLHRRGDRARRRLGRQSSAMGRRTTVSAASEHDQTPRRRAADPSRAGLTAPDGSPDVRPCAIRRGSGAGSIRGSPAPRLARRLAPPLRRGSYPGRGRRVRARSRRAPGTTPRAGRPPR